MTPAEALALIREETEAVRQSVRDLQSFPFGRIEFAESRLALAEALAEVMRLNDTAERDDFPVGRMLDIAEAALIRAAGVTDGE